MERWAPARERPRRRPGQPSFSSTLLDAICDAMDEQPGGARTGADTATEWADAMAAAKKQQEAALHCYYYYKPSLAASHRAARVAEAPGAGADDCHGRGYFSSSEVEYSLRRLRPIRTSGAGAGSAAAPQAEKQQHPATEKARRAKKQANGSARGGCRRPASPGARLASLLNAIFTGKRHSARQHPTPPEDEAACSTAPSTARPCSAKTPPSARARAGRCRSRTVRFLDIDGEVAVAAAVAGRRQIPVVEVEVEEVLFRPAYSDGGEESSDASSDLFELENMTAVDAAGGGGGHRRACGDELPVYGTADVGLRRDIGRRRQFGYGGLGRSYSRVV